MIAYFTCTGSHIIPRNMLMGMILTRRPGLLLWSRGFLGFFGGLFRTPSFGCFERNAVRSSRRMLTRHSSCSDITVVSAAKKGGKDRIENRLLGIYKHNYVIDWGDPCISSGVNTMTLSKAKYRVVAGLLPHPEIRYRFVMYLMKK